ncbi:MAG: general secretion pathway protein GspB [Candidatus Omnitrophica bacterium]|nr:general secretion pathway protein GspB [Candidatus Omnitrophota bacterium]MBU4479179.1 general secretion pathway protein GspB [Candidatus Omnitrophota bacterium]MCG2704082.1 general secretion pathway protein GspB [Candidatus Omnitrophota bacterium]
MKNSCVFLICSVLIFFSGGCGGTSGKIETNDKEELSDIIAYFEQPSQKKNESRAEQGQPGLQAEPVPEDSLPRQRNPFLSLAETVRFLQGDEETWEGVSLSAVFYSGDNSYAVINGRIVKINDVIDGKKVVEIRPDAVVLKDIEKRYIVYLSEA